MRLNIQPMDAEEARQLGVHDANAWSEERLRGLIVAFPGLPLLSGQVARIAYDEVRQRGMELTIGTRYGNAFINRMIIRLVEIIYGSSGGDGGPLPDKSDPQQPN